MGVFDPERNIFLFSYMLDISLFVARTLIVGK